jgi:hypothetical protein
LSARRGERNLSGVKQLGCVVVINGVDEHGVRDTGDEVADVFVADERRESGAVGAMPTGRGAELSDMVSSSGNKKGIGRA